MKKVKWNEVDPYEILEKSSGFLLWEVSKKWNREVEKSLSSLGITHAQFILLSAIGMRTRDGGQITQIEAARVSQTDIATTSQIFRILEGKELIETRQSIAGERSKLSKLTERGFQLLQNAAILIENLDQEFFGDLFESSFKTLDLLNKR